MLNKFLLQSWNPDMGYQGYAKQPSFLDDLPNDFYTSPIAPSIATRPTFISQVTQNTLNGISQSQSQIFNSTMQLTPPNISASQYLPSKPTIKKRDGTNYTDDDFDTPHHSTLDEKFTNSAIGQNSATINKGLDTLGGITNSLGGKDPYSTKNGALRKGIDEGYNAVADAAANFGPYGQMISMGMKAANMLNGIQGAIFGATDGMTKADAIMDSPLGFLTGLGWINQAFGKKSDTITKNEEAFSQVGSSYGGANALVDDSLNYSGKKYGAFSSGARKDANSFISEARRQNQMIGTMADTAADRFALQGSMAAINGNRRAFALQGGYDQSAIRVGRHGMIIQDLQHARRITSSLKYQKGGKVSDPFQTYLQTLPENQRDDSDFRVRDYWEFNGKPKDFEEAISRGMFTQFDDGWHANSVAENPNTGEIEFMKSSSHPSIQKELDWYNSDDASEFRNQYELQRTEPYFKYVKRKGTDQPQSFKEGGSLTKSDWLVEVDINNIPFEFKGEDIEEVELDSILPEFKEGGKFNLIPEGALHARKHNMDVEGITPKGIPVVSEVEGGELEQQAEIEREEIIFRLEVTKKIEELAKNGSDEAAIEAGKLLVKEILYNTIDNTNSLI